MTNTKGFVSLGSLLHTKEPPFQALNAERKHLGLVQKMPWEEPMPTLEGNSIKCITDKFTWITLGKIYTLDYNGSHGPKVPMMTDDDGHRQCIDGRKGIFWTMFEVIPEASNAGC